MRKYYCDLCKKEVPEKEELRNCDWFILKIHEEICYKCAKTIWKQGKKFVIEVGKE